MLQPMGSQTVGHNSVTEQQQQQNMHDLHLLTYILYMYMHMYIFRGKYACVYLPMSLFTD